MRKRKTELDGPVINPVDSAWRLFETTGNVNYYMLYKNLLNGQEDRKK